VAHSVSRMCLEVGSLGMYRLSSTHVSVASLARERPNLNSSWLTEFARYGSNLRIVIGQSKYQIDKGIDTTSFTCKSDFD
jgi:hypothetical protein